MTLRWITVGARDESTTGRTGYSIGRIIHLPIAFNGTFSWPIRTRIKWKEDRWIHLWISEHDRQWIRFDQQGKKDKRGEWEDCEWERMIIETSESVQIPTTVVKSVERQRLKKQDGSGRNGQTPSGSYYPNNRSNYFNTFDPHTGMHLFSIHLPIIYLSLNLFEYVSTTVMWIQDYSKK